MLTARPRGTNDILPGEIEIWQYIEEIIRKLCYNYGYQEIQTPLFEHTELFLRGVGETSDVVEKEMYTFNDRGNRSITLRPEGTASVVRAYLEGGLHTRPQPVKLFYIGPMFRYDRPQAGRYRQFHQFGVEVFGSHDPAVDAEVIAMAIDFCKHVGLKDLELHINSIGCPGCRPVLYKKLQQYFQPKIDSLCANCKERLQKNPLRVLDCKEARCQETSKGAPTSPEFLCDVCSTHFLMVQRYLNLLGVSYIINGRLVRGLDYYTQTAFEVMVGGIGAQKSIGGGGRYDGLVEACGGPSIPGTGYAVGLERLILALKQQVVCIPVKKRLKVFIATADSEAEEEAFLLLAELRNFGIAAEKDYLGRSLKAQMKSASRLNVDYTLIIGESELSQGTVLLRKMSDGKQEEIPRKEVLTRFSSNFRKIT